MIISNTEVGNHGMTLRAMGRNPGIDPVARKKRAVTSSKDTFPSRASSGAASRKDRLHNAGKRMRLDCLFEQSSCVVAIGPGQGDRPLKPVSIKGGWVLAEGGLGPLHGLLRGALVDQVADGLEKASHFFQSGKPSNDLGRHIRFTGGFSRINLAPACRAIRATSRRFAT